MRPTIGRTAAFLLLTVVTSANVFAQVVVVEWMEYACEGAQCLVLNAYVSEVTRTSDDADVPAPVEAERIAAVHQQLPISALPIDRELQPFLDVIGVRSVRDLEDLVPDDLPVSSGFALWHTLVRHLRTKSELNVGPSRVVSREVSTELQRVYSAQGYPSKDDPYLPHLSRGVLAVYNERGEISEITRTVDIGIVDVALPKYVAVRFANLGRRPVRLFADTSPFSGISVGDVDEVVAPGTEVSTLLRFDASLLSVITRQCSAVIGYESEGEAVDIVYIKGSHRASAVAALLSTFDNLYGAHLGYWRQVPLYRYASFLVGIGALILVTFLCGRELGHLGTVFSNLASRSRARKLHLKTERGTAGDEPQETGSRASLMSRARLRFTTFADVTLQPFRRPHVALFNDFGERLRRTLARFHEAGRNASSNGQQATYPAETHEPASPRDSIDRLRHYKVQQAGGPDTSARVEVDAAVLRREVSNIARELDSNLRKGRLAQTIENFQLLWAVRLLAAVLAKPETDARAVLTQWLSGVDKVLEHKGPQAVGPTNWEFMGLARELEE